MFFVNWIILVVCLYFGGNLVFMIKFYVLREKNGIFFLLVFDIK